MFFELLQLLNRNFQLWMGHKSLLYHLKDITKALQMQIRLTFIIDFFFWKFVLTNYPEVLKCVSVFKHVTGVKALIGDLAGSLNNYSGKHSARKQKGSFRKVTCIFIRTKSVICKETEIQTTLLAFDQRKNLRVGIQGAVFKSSTSLWIISSVLNLHYSLPARASAVEMMGRHHWLPRAAPLQFIPAVVFFIQVIWFQALLQTHNQC